MRKALVVVVFLLLPSIVWSQSTLRVTSLYGPVDWKPASGKAFLPLSGAAPQLSIGDRIRTGDGASLTLELPDGSYIVVSEHSTLTIEQFWGSNVRNLVDLLMGKVRFYIQRLGGRPNPYRVNTPTALIAVRGTTFDVIVDEGRSTEVRCLEGRVAVETIGLPDREVILEEGRKTLVRHGEYPLTPVQIVDAFARSKVIRVVKKGAEETSPVTAETPGVDPIARDNDRRQKSVDRFEFPRSRDNSPSQQEVQRSKPSLTYPEGQ